MTNLYKEEYDARKTATLEYLDKSIRQLREWEQEDVAAPLEKQRKNVQDELFSIVLVGEFSAGKSTFLNALMHKRILPSFTRETTATVNFLRHVDQAPQGVLGRVVYRNGTVEELRELDQKTIEAVVSTNGDSAEQTVAETIDHVDFFLNSEFLQNGVMLVDSPGLNGMRGNHREITEQQIKASHACIFMFRAEQPGSRTEFEFLHHLKSQSKNLLFVMNKIDAIKSSENQAVEDVIKDLRSTYQKQFPDEKELPKIWPLASYAALVARDSNETEYLGNERVTTQERRDELEQFSQFAAFEQRLWKYLTEGERAYEQLRGPVNAATGALRDQRAQFDAEIKLLEDQASGEDMEKQKEILEKNLAELQKNRQAASPELTKQVKAVVRDLQECADRQRIDIARQIQTRLEECDLPTEIQDESANLTAELEQKFYQLASKLDNKLREELLNIVSEEYEKYILEMEEQFEEVSQRATIQFRGKEIVVSDASIDIDLAKYDEQCNELQKKIEQLENSNEEIQRSVIKQRRIETEIQEKKSALADIQQSRQFIATSFSIPDVAYSQENVDASHWRGGVLGLIGNALFGKKKAQSLQTIVDSTARDEAVAKQDKLLANIDAEISEKKNALQQSAHSEQSSEELEQEHIVAQGKIAKLEEQRRQMLERHLSELQAKSAKACKRMRRDIMEGVDAFVNDVSAEIQDHIRKQEKQYIHAVQEILNVSLDREITAAQKRLDDLIALTQTEGAARDKRLEEARNAEATCVALTDEGFDLMAMLELKMQDRVEQEVL